jgi:two-component system sensor histidine kinase KdpD
MRLTVAEAAPLAEDAGQPQASGTTLELLSSIAHEFRAPLSALTASAEMLQCADPDDQDRFAAIIQRQASRLNAIVEGLLEVYRAPKGALHRITEPIDAADLIDEVRVDHELLFPRHIFVAEVPEAARVFANRRILSMILSNVVANAAKYSPAGSTVRISLEYKGSDTVLRVRDQGPGIPEFMRRKIFRAGERGAFGGESGCGLGLFIAQQLCAAIGARIEVEDRDDGRGACFAVTVVG